METMAIGQLALYYEPEEREAADLIREACEKTIAVLRTRWALESPRDCRVYVMTSWEQFMLHAAPQPLRSYLRLTMPLRRAQLNRLWELAGGWAVPFGQRRAVGIKPPRLIRNHAASAVGVRLFIKVDDVHEKVRRTTCHELTHGFTTHIRSLSWLYEGTAMIAVDDFAGKPTVRPDTLSLLERQPGKPDSERLRRLPVHDEDAMVRHYARGYWLTRYLEEKQPGLLKGLLAQQLAPQAIETTIASTLGISRERFWAQVDGLLAGHFGQAP
jgi:hypothetical protein